MILGSSVMEIVGIWKGLVGEAPGSGGIESDALTHLSRTGWIVYLRIQYIILWLQDPAEFEFLRSKPGSSNLSEFIESVG